jgi:hypothetical protein
MEHDSILVNSRRAESDSISCSTGLAREACRLCFAKKSQICHDESSLHTVVSELPLEQHDVVHEKGMNCKVACSNESLQLLLLQDLFPPFHS